VATVIEFLRNYGIRAGLDYVTTFLDIGVVAYLIYKLLTLIRGTRAVPLINGILVLAIGWLVAWELNLYTLQWLLQNAFIAASVAIPIIFQPELRRALEQLGRGRLLPTNRHTEDLQSEELKKLIDQLVRAAEILGRTKTGALMVLERETGLGEYIDSGIKLDAIVTWELLTNIFVEKTPLHDGAVIIRANRAAAAACWLPLAEASVLSHDLGTRHRAGVGITEQSDAVVVIVSEETGTISVAQGGKLIRHLDDKTLREMLSTLLDVNKPSEKRRFWHWGAAS
jgi:diadenylate cyclase